MGTIAAAPGRVPAVSFTTVWWAIVRAIVVAVILAAILSIPGLIIGQIAGLPIVPAGTGWSFAWPFFPDLLWFRLLDLLFWLGVGLWAAVRLRTSLADDDVTIGLIEAVAAVGLVMGLFSVSRPASVAATVPVAALLRWAARPGRPEPLGVRRRARWVAVAVAVLFAGSVIAVNAVPVAAQSNAGCGATSGSVPLESPADEGTSGSPQRFGYAPARVGLPAVCLENRAWFARATVLGLDAAALPAERPWTVSLVHGLSFARDGSMRFDPIGQVVLGSRSDRVLNVLLRFDRCRPWMAGRTYTLAAVPLRVRAYGRLQTDWVRFSQPVQTTCPGVG